ncbi:hypothetical protein V8J88_19000 [Massilia sp. W12]|uniref:hypothetical protein n=1 Tax=Massilia sp. W12 TaxID=3126507 RepID=UPI0030CB0E94
MVAILKPVPPQSALAERMARWRYAWRRLWLHGGWALLAAPLLLAAALLAWRGHLLREQRQAMTQAAQTPLRAHLNAPDLAQQIQRFEQTLPQHASAPQQLRRLLEIAAEQDVPLPQAEYRQSTLTNSTLQRWQITLPLHVSYGKLLRFLQTAMEEMPALALDNLQVRRASSDTDEVEVRLQLSLIINPQPVRQRSRHE